MKSEKCYFQTDGLLKEAVSLNTSAPNLNFASKTILLEIYVDAGTLSNFTVKFTCFVKRIVVNREKSKSKN